MNVHADKEQPTPAVLVTGASSGIGQAVTLHLAQRGYRVYAGVRGEPAAAALRAVAGEGLDQGAVGAAGAGSTGCVVPLQLDITDSSQIGSAAEQIAAASPAARLAGIVNNAGIAVAGPLEFLPLEDLRQQLEVNVLGQVAVTQAMLPNLRASNGRIVFIGSVSGLVSSRLLGAYSASKFAMEAVADAFRRELATWDLKVSVVEPGRIATPIWDRSVADATERLERLPPAALEYYRPLVETLLGEAKEAGETGAAPGAVAAAVLRALTERRPRTRYFVGSDAHIVNVLRRVLSDPLLDRLVRSKNR